MPVLISFFTLYSTQTKPPQPTKLKAIQRPIKRDLLRLALPEGCNGSRMESLETYAVSVTHAGPGSCTDVVWSKWVFCIEYNEDGSADKYKYRFSKFNA